MPSPDTTARRTPLQQAQEATELAQEAFANGDNVYGIAALSLASQLIELAKLLGHTE